MKRPSHHKVGGRFCFHPGVYICTGDSGSRSFMKHPGCFPIFHEGVRRFRF